MVQRVVWSVNDGYQINSKTDKRFSAFYAIMNDGRSIEEHYQCTVKGYASIKDGKGKPPIANLNKDLFTEYLSLWRQWSIGKDELLADLFEKVKQNNWCLGDFFAKTNVNQAAALSVILNEKFLNYKRVIVAGSRSISNYNTVKQAVSGSGILISTIVSGAAQGVDTLGERYAEENNIPIERYKADWQKHGKSAGYIRNAVMADNADALVCVWDGESKGTRHMIGLAMKKKLRLNLILEGDKP